MEQDLAGHKGETRDKRPWFVVSWVMGVGPRNCEKKILKSKFSGFLGAEELFSEEEEA